MNLAAFQRVSALSLLMAASTLSLMAQSTMRFPNWNPDDTRKELAKNRAGAPARTPCRWLPLWGSCTGDAAKKYDYINSFWNTADTFSFFNQVKSVYNSASSGTTVAADLASLNFGFGVQLVAGTNLQAAPAAPATASSNGSAPTITAASAGQAAQNILHGGTIYLAALYPLLAVGQEASDKPGNLALSVNLVGRQGIDVQNFKSGSNISVTSPPTHTNAQLETYLVLNAINLLSDKTTVAGSVIFGGSYGYGYTSHQYARDYGFGPRVSHGIGEISAGLLLSKVATIKVSRAFGPGQSFIDATSNLPRNVNSFKVWSIGITYQADNQQKK